MRAPTGHIFFVFGLLAGASGVISPASAQPRIGPSFSCTGAKDTIAVLICSDPRLARTDLAFVQAYQALRQQVGDSGQRDLRQQAIDFQNGVYTSCNLPRATTSLNQIPSTAVGCVGAMYEQQRGAWMQRLAGPAAEEASRPLERHIQLQHELQQLGYIPSSTAIDGVYGTGTRAAINSWQRSSLLQATGFLGDDDARRLDQALYEADRASQAQAARARLEASMAADAQARQEAERQAEESRQEAQRAADARRAQENSLRDQAVATLEAKLPSPHEEATVFLQLGSQDERVRKTLKGGYLLIDAGRPARGCMTVSVDANPAFAAAALARVAGPLLGRPTPTSLRPCTPDALQHSDLVLEYDPAHASMDRATAEALAAFIGNPQTEAAGHLAVGEWEAALAAEREAAEARAQAREKIADDVRSEALAGALHDWAAIELRERAGGPVCIVSADSTGWSAALGTISASGRPVEAAEIIADSDADRQFGRLLSGACEVLVAHGTDAGDVLRGLEANHRTAVVLPVRLAGPIAQPGSGSGTPSSPAAAAPTVAPSPPAAQPKPPTEIVPSSTP